MWFPATRREHYAIEFMIFVVFSNQISDKFHIGSNYKNSYLTNLLSLKDSFTPSLRIIQQLFTHLCTRHFSRAKTAKNTYSTQEFGSNHWMEPNMVAHGQVRSNPQFEMHENGSKQNLLNSGTEVWWYFTLNKVL